MLWTRPFFLKKLSSSSVTPPEHYCSLPRRTSVTPAPSTLSNGCAKDTENVVVIPGHSRLGSLAPFENLVMHLTPDR